MIEYSDVKLKRLSEVIERLITYEGNEFAFSVMQSFQNIPGRIAFERLMQQTVYMRRFLEELDYVESGKRDFKTVD